MDTHEEHEENRGPLAGGAEANISHFIPSVELKGSRADKLEKLDTLIIYLERLRRSLAGDVIGGGGGFEGPGKHKWSPSWPWFLTGTLLGALFVLLMISARACGYDFFTNS